MRIDTPKIIGRPNHRQESIQESIDDMTPQNKRKVFDCKDLRNSKNS
jgi:hypothetical protein